MKRRKFFFLARSGVAGITVSTSLKPSPKNDASLGSETKLSQTINKEPLYRKNIKSSFNIGKFKSAKDN